MFFLFGRKITKNVQLLKTGFRKFFLGI